MKEQSKSIFTDRLDAAWKNMKNDPAALQIYASDRPRSMAMADERLLYYSAFDESDTCLIASETSVLLEKLIQYLTETGWYYHRSIQAFDSAKNVSWPTQQHWLREGGYMLVMNCSWDKMISISGTIENQLLGPKSNAERSCNEKRPALVDQFELFYPAKNIRDEQTQMFITDFMDFCHKNYYHEDNSSKIGIISHDGTEFYVKNFSLEGKVPAFVHADEHYGDGFLDFHNKMITRIKTESKGLILFHGDPGTGKTQYIRMLLDILTRSNKSILYVPPSFSSQLTEPQMIEFISDWVLEEDQDCILLIEDAEPLLETRNNGQDGRSTGISNLLNMTDGILNDMLGLMVIATFNTSISMIDSALLRPQRLIARKEFTRISQEQAQRLADALKIKLPAITYPATLAEFYTEEKQASILTHGVKEERRIGFKK